VQYCVGIISQLSAASKSEAPRARSRQLCACLQLGMNAWALGAGCSLLPARCCPPAHHSAAPQGADTVVELASATLATFAQRSGGQDAIHASHGMQVRCGGCCDSVLGSATGGRIIPGGLPARTSSDDRR
jgi:hypothetical protein